jgi:hypothetical protein
MLLPNATQRSFYHHADELAKKQRANQNDHGGKHLWPMGKVAMKKVKKHEMAEVERVGNLTKPTQGLHGQQPYDEPPVL